MIPKVGTGFRKKIIRKQRRRAGWWVDLATFKWSQRTLA